MPADIAKARTEWASRDDLYGRCETGPFEEAEQAFENKEWDSLRGIAQSWVDRCPVNIDPRFFSMVAFEELGRVDEATEQRRWVRGLVDSVLSTGDGRTPTTAYLVFTIAEEYSILRLFGYAVDSQALLDKGIDVLGVHHVGTKTELSVYFNPEPHWRALEKRFQ